MTVKIKKIKYLLTPKDIDILNDAVDIFITLEDDYCTDGFGYVVEVTTPEFLSTIIKKENRDFLPPNYPYIIVSKLTDDIIKKAIESFINADNGARLLKLYHTMPKLEIEEIDEILYRKKQEAIELEAEIDAELEEDLDTKD